MPILPTEEDHPILETLIPEFFVRMGGANLNFDVTKPGIDKPTASESCGTPSTFHSKK